ncbi:MAG: O-antigen ligase family protein, partial [Giesbergeria sp.]
HWLVFFLACALLGLAPVLRGGNRQIALVGLLLLSALLLAVLLGSVSFDRLFGAAGNTAERREKRRAVMPLWSALLLLFVASSPLWLGFLQLVPLSAGSWASLAGRGLYFDALAAAGGSAPQDLPLSLNPDATLTALLSGIPALATLLAALFLPRPLVEKCLVVLLTVGAFEMLLAVLQFWMGPGSLLYFGVESAAGFVGSFANRNHLADFLVMLMPLWFLRMAQGASGREAGLAAHQRGSQFGAVSALWLFFGFALLVVTLATLSRGGLLSGALVLMACTLLLIVKLKSKLSRKQQILLAIAAGVFALLALAGVGAERVGQRLEKATLQLDAETRNNFTAATLDGARAFWPWGSGAGTFESVFPRFQAADSLFYIEYAHNDYAQLLMELGLPGLLLALAVAALVLAQWVRLLCAYRAERRLSGELALRAYCGLGALALLLHSTVEFNMHIPALALTAAFLLGVYLRPLGAPRTKA